MVTNKVRECIRFKGSPFFFKEGTGMFDSEFDNFVKDGMESAEAV